VASGSNLDVREERVMIKASTGQPPDALLEWVVDSRAASTIVRTAPVSQSGEGGPWWLSAVVEGRETALVLKAEQPDDAARQRLATAGAALEVAAANDIAAPRLVALDVEAACGWHALLTTALPGSSSIAAGITSARLRALGSEAARLHLVAGTPTTELPVRSRSLEGYDLNAGTTATASTPLLDEARQVLADVSLPHEEPFGFVHGDFWQGNTLWDGDRYTGAVDWDFAGFGPAGIDLGSLRADVVVLHGAEAGDEVLAGWEATVGRPAPNLAWWDLVAGVSTPEDMGGWLPNFHAQGRTDLDLAVITRRRDEFVKQGLHRLTRAS
jgi:aminoglycoside phosphotransferase (APT) family kinase protein